MRNMKWNFWLGLMLICSQSMAQTLTSEDNLEGILVKEGDMPVLFFQKKTTSKDGTFPRANYVHPLYGLNGQILTEDFPDDHLHHRGIFWSWHQVLIGEKSIGDAWACEDFSWDVESREPLLKSDGTLELRAKTYWKSPLWKDYIGEEVAFLSESTRITVHPRNENYRIIDFEIALLALEPDLKIGGSNDDKGYGGFSVRMILPDDIQFNSSTGQVTPTTNALSAGPWMDMSGSGVDGTNFGIVIISHLDNPTHPEPWILRNNRSMQNVVYPGRKPAAISNREATKLKYRLIIYQDQMSVEKIQAIFSDYD
ncbi:MAG: hypothetical protein HKN76_18185 [Saprospiraceae bacterium]|nr:hypothetical protein [Saprospiraceae bacterium]